MIEWLLPVTVMAALLAGWFAGRAALRREHGKPVRLSADYYRGLNYLLNEKPDQALEVFLRLVEVDSETVETHITLGKLFRKRGEIEKAIRVHQNLIARPVLAPADRSLALLELGHDYLAAGVLDRAEGLFQQVKDSGFRRTTAMRGLLNIYIQEQEWSTAIEVAGELNRLSKDNYSGQVAHFYCELAREAMQREQYSVARQQLQRAQQVDAFSLRTNYMRAELEQALGNSADALQYYIRAVELDTRFASDILPQMQECLEGGGHRRLQKHIDALFERLRRDGVYVQPLTQKIREEEGIEQAKLYLEGILSTQPCLDALLDWLSLHPVSVETRRVREQAEKFAQIGHPYHCEQCGYNSRRLQWHCPSCSSWGSIVPTPR
ncbi:MAG: lipopolysaccharide assembly protein LapB [Pseudomonadota bacterium]